MLPTVKAESIKIVRYAAEVSGRIEGVAAMTNLVPTPERRTVLTNASNTIVTATRALHAIYVTRSQFEDIDHRITFGKGKGVDRGFEGIVAVISESTRTSLADRVEQNPDYRAIFPNGTDEYTSPTIREDEELAADLRTSLAGSNLREKDTFIALIDEVIPVVGPAARELSAGEQQVNRLFQNEINARKVVVDALWEQKRLVETALGRAGKGLARFIFFDFRKLSDADDSASPEPGNVPTP
ncbi:MAG TPA: hypothetical protein PK156_16580 [Polyangium sp.]|nr:hypothetical protein [Polyangium sp.]